MGKINGLEELDSKFKKPPRLIRKNKGSGGCEQSHTLLIDKIKLPMHEFMIHILNGKKEFES
jgi:hypothetical protein